MTFSTLRSQPGGGVYGIPGQDIPVSGGGVYGIPGQDIPVRASGYTRSATKATRS